MLRAGLVSVSFRNESPETIIKAAKNAGLSCIEWGSDIHAPCDDHDTLRKISELMKQNGLECCSYGTYFRFGKDSPEGIIDYINAAKILGTDIIRVWAGVKNAEEYTQHERNRIYLNCRVAADIAKKCGVTLCCECHNNTLTNTYNGAVELIQLVKSESFGMYWQPNQFRTVEYNIESAKVLSKYTKQIHVFNWENREKYPLSEAIDIWKQYIKFFDGDHDLLLEFMPDNDIKSLAKEAEALKKIIGE